MEKTFGDNSLAGKFETVSLSHQTVARIAHIDEHVTAKLCDIVKKCYFSLCLDDSTD